jgi:hypothetical protein
MDGPGHWVSDGESSLQETLHRDHVGAGPVSLADKTHYSGSLTRVSTSFDTKRSQMST